MSLSFVSLVNPSLTEDVEIKVLPSVAGRLVLVCVSDTSLTYNVTLP